MSMKNIYLIIFLIPVFVFSNDKNYWITDVNIIAQLNSDGSMNIKENRTFKFKGSYKYIYQKFKKTKGYDYLDFKISEGENFYFLSDNQNSGNYSLKESKDHIEIKVYQKSKNESRTFSIEYIITGIIEKNIDAALMYYKFIGDQWNKSQSNINIQLYPPSELKNNDIQAWLH